MRSQSCSTANFLLPLSSASSLWLLPPLLSPLFHYGAVLVCKILPGCRSVNLRICFSRSILPFISFLYIGVWDSAAKNSLKLEARAFLQSSLSARAAWGGGGGGGALFVGEGHTSCCRVCVLGGGDQWACSVALTLLLESGSF